MAYTPQKRKRSWFFDNNIPTEPRTYIDNNGQTVTKQVKTRLAKNHLPKEETFQDLLQSVFFKSVGTDNQDIATTPEIHSQQDIEKVVKPNQLPDLINSQSEVIGDFNSEVFIASKSNLSTKVGWYYQFTTGFKNWLLSRLIPSGGTASQVLKKVSNNDYDISWQNDNTGTGLPPYTQPADDNKILRIDAVNGAEWKTPDFASQTALTSEINSRIAGDNGLQVELDVTQVGAGLNTNGTYTANGSANYINTATSLKNADDLLDTKAKNLQDQITALTPSIIINSNISLSSPFVTATFYSKKYNGTLFFQIEGTVSANVISTAFFEILPSDAYNDGLLVGGVSSSFIGRATGNIAIRCNFNNTGAISVDFGTTVGAGTTFTISGSYICI